jgi:hypothetical protein
MVGGKAIKRVNKHNTHKKLATIFVREGTTNAVEFFSTRIASDLFWSGSAGVGATNCGTPAHAIMVLAFSLLIALLAQHEGVGRGGR